MRRVQCWMAVMICWVAAMIPAPGQALPEWLAKDGAPKPPDFGIRDESGFFNKDAGGFKRISDRFRKLEAEHGYKVFLMVEPVLIGTSAPELAAQLRQAWLPDGNGLVIIFEADTRSVGIGRDLAVSPDPKAPEALIPTHETAALISRAIDEVDAKLAPEAYIEALSTKLVEECHGYFELREAPVPAGRAMRVGLLAAGALALLALLGIGLGWLLRHSAMAEVPTFRFPVVDRPERLGAPCGAAVTARRFGPQPAKRA